jgi:4-alpha-glucanotransferase
MVAVVRLSRSAGILLHPTSLPSGSLADARWFVDWLASAGQAWWQVLPLGPPDETGSPYAARSAFAASPGLLAEPDAPVSDEELEAFVARHPFWSADWANYDARAGEAGTGSQRHRKRRLSGGSLADQVRFEREWSGLRAYAARRGVRLIGDLPIYVAPGSADHRAHPELFQTGVVAGVPPDLFSANGQLWGNPLYDWNALRATGYRWWVERFRRALELVDLVRVDHFRGLVAYWSVAAGRKTARAGRWRRAPGRELLETVRSELGSLPVVAEDLGLITPAVERLRDELGLPGMAVLQFAFDGNPRNPHLPQHHRELQLVYTGTHDNDTAVGWYEAQPRAGLDPAEPNWSLIRMACESRAAIAVVPAQDVLGLGSEARMNTPGRRRGNWSWRLEPRQLTEGHAERLFALAARTRRAGTR